MDGSHNNKKEKDNGQARNSNTRRTARALRTNRIGSIFTMADGLNERGRISFSIEGSNSQGGLSDGDSDILSCVVPCVRSSLHLDLERQGYQKTGCKASRTSRVARANGFRVKAGISLKTLALATAVTGSHNAEKETGLRSHLGPQAPDMIGQV